MVIPEEDLICTLSLTGRAEIKVKGSRFVGVAAPALTREEGGKIVRAEEKKYHDASHHPWAWRSVGNASGDFGYTDDREPSGTAGMPILGAIDNSGLSGVIVVVTRYFGGVKLGTGGLARAYAQAAREAIAQAQTVSGMMAEEFSLYFDYSLLGIVSRLAESSPAVITRRDFSQQVGLNIAVSRSRAESFIRYLNESTAGKIEIKSLGIRPVFPD